MPLRSPHSYSRVDHGPYSPENPWGQVPAGGTQLCRFHQLNDALGAKFTNALHRAVGKIAGLNVYFREGELPRLGWDGDRPNTYKVALGLVHRAEVPERKLTGLLTIYYEREGVGNARYNPGYVPLSLELTPADLRTMAHLLRLVLAEIHELRPAKSLVKS